MIQLMPSSSIRPAFSKTAAPGYPSASGAVEHKPWQFAPFLALQRKHMHL